MRTTIWSIILTFLICGTAIAEEGNINMIYYEKYDNVPTIETISNIFVKNTLTDEEKLVAKLPGSYNFGSIVAMNGYLYFSGHSEEICGIFRYNLENGDTESIVELNENLYDYVRSFTVVESLIYYCTYSKEYNDFVIFEYEIDSNQSKIMKEKTGWVGKISINNDKIIYTTTTAAVMIQKGKEKAYLENYYGSPSGGIISGNHFIVGDKLILTNYFGPVGYEEYGYNPTIIMNLDGEVIEVWKNIVVDNIKEFNNKIYAQLTLKEENGYGDCMSGIFNISNDFKNKNLMIETEIFSLGYTEKSDFYIKDNIFHFKDFFGIWSKGDIHEDGSIKNMTIENKLNEEKSHIDIFIDKKIVSFDISPIIENDHTLVPFRAIFEEFGASVEWYGDTQTVMAKLNETEIKLTIGVTKTYVNNEPIELDVAPKIVNDRTLIPLRFIAENFGFKVDWNEELKRVDITTK